MTNICNKNAVRKTYISFVLTPTLIKTLSWGYKVHSIVMVFYLLPLL